MSGGFGFGIQNTTANTGTTFSFGSTPTTTSAGISFGTPATGTTGGFQFSSPGQTAGGLSFGTPQTTTTASPGGFMFGSNQQPGGLTFGTPQTTPATTSAFKTTASGLGSGQQTALSFGSTTPQMTTLGFGPTTPQTTVSSFGTTPQATVPAFGSALQTTTAAPTFSLTQQTKTTTAAAPLTFGPTPQTTLSFGSSAPLSFGLSSSMPQAMPTLVLTPQTKPTTLSSATPVTTTTGLTFGPTQTTASSISTPQATIFATPTPPTTGLLFGTPATTTTSVTAGAKTAAARNVPDTRDDGSKSTFFTAMGSASAAKPTIPFGIPTAAPAITMATTTSAAPSTGLFSFSTPKTTTTASTGFSLSTTTAGSLFSSFPAVTTTSAAATTATTTTTTPFKGLGGVDTTTSLTGILGGTSGRSDIKSIKENALPNEIMQTIDTFKNFVKQQKNLACEITRTSGKPMNKVTEDTDSLKQILTTVHSALQKNRQISNKLKADTTKCLLLCEMAQHTHDTPVGLQNENIAPLEFFLQLATKFEKDVTNLRTEIDNTEKHVNSLSQPAVLTPQELSIALRRLHDSFVALAGQLQTAHATVAIQKERHLNLRRHFLKDNTNIFEPDNKSSSYMKSFKMPVTLSPGPTPFSSMGNTQGMSMLSSQDKSGPTFPATSTSLSGWGTTPTAPTGTSLLQTTGNTSLFSPQPVENQNFQLLKPPPGNKRGKR